MENFPVSIDMYTAVVGLLLPLLISTILSPDWTKQTKGWISFGLVFLAAAGHLFFIGDFDIASFPGTLLKVLFLATGSYLSFWKPTGINDAVEKNVGTKAKETGTYGEQGFAKIKLLLVLAALASLVMTVPAFALDVTLAWDANTESNLAGYKIHYNLTQDGPPYNGTGAMEGNSPIDVGNVTEFSLHGFPDDASIRFVATAYNDQGLESGYSNEVIGSLAPANPQGMLISAIEKIIAALEDVKTYLAQAQ